MSRTLAPLVLLIAVSTLALAGCSTGAPTSTSTAHPQSSATSASTAGPTSAASAGASSGAAIDVCTAVPRESVNAITGRDYTAVVPVSTTISGVSVTGCEYHDGDLGADTDQIILDIQIFHGGDPRGVFAYEESAGDQTEEMSSLSGIGDSAQIGVDEIDVAWGRDVVAVIDALRPGDMSPLSRDAFESLAKQAHQAQ